MDGDGRRRWRPLAIDLNNLPPVDEDDVVITPQTNYLTINLRPRGVADSETMVFYPPGTEFSWFPSMRQRSRRLQTQEPVAVIIRDQGASFSVVESVAPPPSPPPSSFSCSICFEPLVNETATKCGHVFLSTLHRKCNYGSTEMPNMQAQAHTPGSHPGLLTTTTTTATHLPLSNLLETGGDATATNCGHIFCEGCIQLAAFNRPECPKFMLLVSHQDLFRICIP